MTMKIKKYLIITLMALLSFTLMACPKIENLPPEFVHEVDGELVRLTSITYEHTVFTTFDPSVMVQSLVDSGVILAIDYNQEGVIWGNNRDYADISDQIQIPTFYAVWLDGEDANGDGSIDELDEDYYGTYKKDSEGAYIYDSAKIALIGILPVDQEIDFTLTVFDDEGASTEVSGTIIIIQAS